MYKSGHFGVNSIVAAAFLVVQPITTISSTLLLLAAGVIILYARLPDRDAHFDPSMNEYRGNAFLHMVPISHRGPVHSFFFAIIVGLVTGLIFSSLAAEFSLSGSNHFFLGWLAGFLGVTGHLLGDMITPAGVPLFWPLTSNRVSLGLVHSNNSAVNNLMFVTGAIVLSFTILSLSEVHLLSDTIDIPFSKWM